jgi:hypothetical protein
MLRVWVEVDIAIPFCGFAVDRASVKRQTTFVTGLASTRLIATSMLPRVALARILRE